MSGYIVRFERVDYKPAEEYYYRDKEDAANHLQLFLDDDSGLYRRIVIIDLDSNKEIATIAF